MSTNARVTTDADPRPLEVSRSMVRVVVAALLALVLLRGFVFVFHPQAHFDSDQAVYGLMARDLAQGQALPVLMYGQRYLLAVSVWLTAPFFIAFGLSRVALKAPILLLNLGVLWMLWRGLRREQGMTATATALAILPFALPGVVVASRLVEHAGGNIEPFVFVLAAFLLRDRPILVGVVLAVGFLNREFTAISGVALILCDVLQGTWRERARSWAITGAVATICVLIGRWVGELGPEYHGVAPTTGTPALSNLFGLVEQQLPTLIEGRAQALSSFNIASSLTVGHWLVGAAATAWLVVLCCSLVLTPPTRRELGGLSTYLILVGGGQALAFALFSPSPHDPMLVRYVLLTLLAIGGLVAYSWRRPLCRSLAVVVVLGMSTSHLIDHVRLIREYVEHPPERDLDRLARALVERGVRYVHADYWTAYDLTFTSGLRVLASPAPGGDRIHSLTARLEEHRTEIYSLRNEPIPGCEKLFRWFLCVPASSRASDRR
jgi:hypothetical protein